MRNNQMITTAQTADRENDAIFRFFSATIELCICVVLDRFPIRSCGTFGFSIYTRNIMSDIYTRRFFCIIRWILFLTSIISIIAGNTILGGFTFAFAAMLAGNKYKYHIPLAKRFKWIGICWVIYFLIFFKIIQQ